MRVAVFGMGYVGLVSAAGLASWGHDVVGIEVARARLEALRSGRLPIHEPGLDDLVAEGVASGRLDFSDHLVAPGTIQVAVIAVGTHDGDGGWQTQTIEACLTGIVPVLADGTTIVIRSTLPPAFLPKVAALVDRLRASVGRESLPVVVNPEFTKEGTAVSDFLRPDRVVVGLISDADGTGTARLRQLYQSVVADTPFLVMAGPDAVLAKLGANLFLATKISFANELAMLCEAYGADVTQVVDGDEPRRPDRRQVPQGRHRLRGVVPPAPGDDDGPRGAASTAGPRRSSPRSNPSTISAGSTSSTGSPPPRAVPSRAPPSRSWA